MGEEKTYVVLAIGINSDSLATWILDAMAPLLKKERFLPDLRLDDRAQTQQLLKDGEVIGCIKDRLHDHFFTQGFDQIPPILTAHYLTSTERFMDLSVMDWHMVCCRISSVHPPSQRVDSINCCRNAGLTVRLY